MTSLALRRDVQLSLHSGTLVSSRAASHADSAGITRANKTASETQFPTALPLRNSCDASFLEGHVGCARAVRPAGSTARCLARLRRFILACVAHNAKRVPPRRRENLLPKLRRPPLFGLNACGIFRAYKPPSLFAFPPRLGSVCSQAHVLHPRSLHLRFGREGI